MDVWTIRRRVVIAIARGGWQSSSESAVNWCVQRHCRAGEAMEDEHGCVVIRQARQNGEDREAVSLFSLCDPRCFVAGAKATGRGVVLAQLPVSFWSTMSSNSTDRTRIALVFSYAGSR